MPPQDSIHSGKIIINEIHHSADGSETRYEFFELYNNSNEEINISGWYFVCGTGSSNTNETNTETGLADSRIGICNNVTGDYDNHNCAVNDTQCSQWIIPGIDSQLTHGIGGSGGALANADEHGIRNSTNDGPIGENDIWLQPGQYILFERHGSSFTNDEFHKYGSFGRGSLKYRGYLTTKTILDLRDENGNRVDYVNYCFKSSPNCDDVTDCTTCVPYDNEYWGTGYPGGTDDSTVGTGHTLELTNPYADNNYRDVWNSSAINTGVVDEEGGTPGNPNSTYNHCFSGCTDPEADNYYCDVCLVDSDFAWECFNECSNCEGTGLPLYVGNDGSCEYSATPGCMDEGACNYNEDATIDDGSCEYPEANFDCDGNCLVDIDCAAECGGNAIIVQCYEDIDGDGLGSGAAQDNCVSNPPNTCTNELCCPDGYVLNDGDDCEGSYDCAGECNGDAVIDDCGICNGDGGTYDCIDNLGCGGDGHCDYSPCYPPDTCGVCDGPGLGSDAYYTDCWNGYEYCEEADCPLQTGCTDPGACNYNPEADEDDDSCIYPEENYDCEGNCAVETDCTGECGGNFIVDVCDVCTDDPVEDINLCDDKYGSCDPQGTLNLCLGCDGNCYTCGEELIVDECGVCGGSGIPAGNCDCDGNIDDCFGNCGGDAVEDECGICNGPGPIYGDGCCESDLDECGICFGENDCTPEGISQGLCACSGCTDPNSDNYDENALWDDGSCEYTEGCTHIHSPNFVPGANSDSGNCDVAIIGYNPCTCQLTADGWVVIPPSENQEDDPNYIQACGGTTIPYCDDNGYCGCYVDENGDLVPDNDTNVYENTRFSIEINEDTSVRISEYLHNLGWVYNPYNPDSLGQMYWYLDNNQEITDDGSYSFVDDDNEHCFEGDDLSCLYFYDTTNNIFNFLGTIEKLTTNFVPAPNLNGEIPINFEVRNGGTGGSTRHSVKVKLIINPIEDPFDFNLDNFHDYLCCGAGGCVCGDDCYCSADETILTLSTDDGNDYPIRTIDLSAIHGGNLSDPEFNYQVSLEMNAADIEKGFDKYLTWNIIGPVIELSPVYGFYGQIGLTLHITDPGSQQEGTEIHHPFKVFINLSDECAEDFEEEFCVDNSHNNGITFPGKSETEWESGLNAPDGIVLLSYISNLLGLYSNEFIFIITPSTHFKNEFNYEAVIGKYRFKVFQCDDNDRRCNNAIPLTQWDEFTTPDPLDDPQGMCIDCIAYEDYLFQQNGRYMFLTEAVDEYDNYRYKKIIFDVNRVVDVYPSVPNLYLPYQGLHLPSGIDNTGDEQPCFDISLETCDEINSDFFNSEINVNNLDLDERKRLGLYYWDEINYYKNWGEALAEVNNNFQCESEATDTGLKPLRSDDNFGCYLDCARKHEIVGNWDGCTTGGQCESNNDCPDNGICLKTAVVQECNSDPYCYWDGEVCNNYDGENQVANPQIHFTPDVDVRTSSSFRNDLDAPILRYWDKEINPNEYDINSGPTEVQFYFYPRERGDIFENKTFHEDLASENYGINSYYIAFLDYGDGTPIDFTTNPHRCGSPINHGYEESGIYTITGFMFRYRGDVEDTMGVCYVDPVLTDGYYLYDVTEEYCNALNDELVDSGQGTAFYELYEFEDEFEVRYFHKFELTIKINKRIGYEDEFRLLGGDDYTFLPYDFTSPIVGGVSRNSLYYKGLKREVGWIDDDFLIRNLQFKFYKDQLKSEYALTQLDENKITEELIKYNQEVHDLSLGAYGSDFNPDESINDDNKIYKGEYKDLYGELGDYFGNSDIAQTKLFLTGKLSMEDMLGFRNEPLEESYDLIPGEGSVLISAPHGCQSFRNTINAIHGSDDNTGAIAIALGELTKAHVIVAKYRADDPNFYHYIPECVGNEEYCTPAFEGHEGELIPYKKALKEYLELHPEIKLVIDFHGANTNRYFAVDIGLRGERNIPPNVDAGAWGDTSYPNYSLNDVLEDPETYAPSLKTEWGKQELLPLLYDTFTSPENIPELGQGNYWIGYDDSDWPQSHCSCDTWDVALFDPPNHWGWAGDDGVTTTDKNTCETLPDCFWVDLFGAVEDINGYEMPVGGVTIHRYFTARKRPTITNYITRDDNEDIISDTGDSEPPLDDDFVESADYLYAGERSWLGNLDAIQLEFSRIYRDFDTYNEMTDGGYIQLKKVTQFINSVNQHYKNEGIIPDFEIPTITHDDLFNAASKRVYEIQDSQFVNVLDRTLDDTVKEELDAGNPSSPRYWKKIIPNTYALDDREGISVEYILTQDGHKTLNGFSLCSYAEENEYCINDEYVVSLTIPQTFDMFYRYVTGIPDSYTRRSSVTLAETSGFTSDNSVDGDALTLGGSEGSYTLNFDSGEFVLEYGSGTEFRGIIDFTNGSISAIINSGEYSGYPCWFYPESVEDGSCNAILTRFDGTKGWFEIDYIGFGPLGEQSDTFQDTASIIRTDNTIYWNLPTLDLNNLQDLESFYSYFGGEDNIINVHGSNNTCLYLIGEDCSETFNKIENGDYYNIVVNNKIITLLPFFDYDINGIIKNVVVDETSSQEWFSYLNGNIYMNEEQCPEEGDCSSPIISSEKVVYPYYPVLPKLNKVGTFNQSNILQGHIPTFGEYPNVITGSMSNRPFGSPGRNWNEDDKTASVTNNTNETNLIGLGEEKIITDLDFSNVSSKDSLSDFSGNNNFGMLISDYKLDYDNNRTPISIKGKFKTTIGKDKDGKAY